MRIFTTPFAQSGDRDTVQESLQTNGVVSYQQGFTADYGKDLGKDPDAKNIERKSFNQLMFDITDTILGIQKVGSQPWNDLLKPYAKGSTIYHGGETYFNLNDNNYNNPAGGGGNWLDTP